MNIKKENKLKITITYKLLRKINCQRESYKSTRK